MSEQPSSTLDDETHVIPGTEAPETADDDESADEGEEDGSDLEEFQRWEPTPATDASGQALHPSADVHAAHTTLRRLVDAVDEKARLLNNAKAALKVAKADWEAACLAEHNFAKSLTGPGQSMPLFDAPPSANGSAHPAEPAPMAEDTSWRDVPLSEALQGLTKRRLGLLAKAGLTTVGELADYTAAEKRLTDIEEIGPVAGEQIENAMADFWARWAPAPEVPADEGAGQEVADATAE